MEENISRSKFSWFVITQSTKISSPHKIQNISTPQKLSSICYYDTVIFILAHQYSLIVQSSTEHLHVHMCAMHTRTHTRNTLTV